MSGSKTSQLQIRVTPAQKRAIKQAAATAGLDVTTWVLLRLLPSRKERFLDLLRELPRTDQVSLVLAALSDLLGTLSRSDFATVVDEKPRERIPEPWLSYVAAMIEERAGALGAAVPIWVRQLAPLEEPYFASALAGLRLHLLTHSPPAFRRRNLFVDRGTGRV